MVGILNSAANDEATAPDCWLRIIHGDEMFLKTKNVLHVVLSHSIPFVVRKVYQKGTDEDQDQKKYYSKYDVWDVVGCRELGEGYDKKNRRNRTYQNKTKYQVTETLSSYKHKIR